MIVTVDDVKAHLNVTTNDDDDIIASKIEVAENIVQKYVGAFSNFPDGVPPALKEAVRQLAGHYYDNRNGEGTRNVPYGVFDLVGPWRQQSFGCD